ncbi:MAG: hypothetical protein D6785_13465 [Planctomycetota bacterium]|nr:MAG: hypothetical protein D6785_13465 [Planctomycetota bacterium]
MEEKKKKAEEQKKKLPFLDEEMDQDRSFMETQPLEAMNPEAVLNEVENQDRSFMETQPLQALSNLPFLENRKKSEMDTDKLDAISLPPLDPCLVPVNIELRKDQIVFIRSIVKKYPSLSFDEVVRASLEILMEKGVPPMASISKEDDFIKVLRDYWHKKR